MAAILVMGYHLMDAGAGSLWPIDGFFKHGDRGILVFFVLSGFLVSRPFVRGPVAVDAYLVRRAARLLPAYLLVLAGSWLVLGDRQFPDHAAAFLLLLQNYDPLLLTTGILGATWTLQLEVQFYLILPVLMGGMALLDRGRGRVGAVLVIVIGLASMGLHVGLSLSPDPNTASVARLSLPAMVWAFVPGIAIAWTLHHRPGASATLASRPVVVTALVAITLGWFGELTTHIGLTGQNILLATGVAMLLPALLSDRSSTPARSRRISARSVVGATASFGRNVSYPFYLWHIAVVTLVMSVGLRDMTAFIAVMLLTTAVGVLSHRLVEMPGMRLGARISSHLESRPDRHDGGARPLAVPLVRVPFVAPARIAGSIPLHGTK